MVSMHVTIMVTCEFFIFPFDQAPQQKKRDPRLHTETELNYGMVYQLLSLTTPTNTHPLQYENSRHFGECAGDRSAFTLLSSNLQFTDHPSVPLSVPVCRKYRQDANPTPPETNLSLLFR